MKRINFIKKNNWCESLQYLKDEDLGLQKVLFTGLDCSGKSSITYALQREFSKIANIEPTKSAQRHIFEYLSMSLSIWDLGGQEKYRISYLKSPGKYFDKTNVAIYVIDILDKERIGEALSYLADVIAQFKKLQIEPPIYIFFHKYDPSMDEKAQGESDDFILDLIDKIIKITKYDKFKYFKTSIYDLSTIIMAMSEIFLTFYPKANLIQESIKAFANKLKAEGVEIIDNNSLIVASFYKSEIVKDILNQSTPYFLTLNDSFQYGESEKSEETPDEKMIIERLGKYFLFFQFKMKKESPPYYLLCVKNDPEFNREEYLTFVKILKEILYK